MSESTIPAFSGIPVPATIDRELSLPPEAFETSNAAGLRRPDRGAQEAATTPLPCDGVRLRFRWNFYQADQVRQFFLITEEQARGVAEQLLKRRDDVLAQAVRRESRSNADVVCIKLYLDGSPWAVVEIAPMKKGQVLSPPVN